MTNLTKKQREAWQSLYAPGDHVELGVEDWAELHAQMEMEFEQKQPGKLLSRIPWEEKQLYGPAAQMVYGVDAQGSKRS